MFLSADALNLAYGVDMAIAKTYVDRPVPPDNAYWKGRLLYVPPVPGFLFMPVFADLCLRCGIPREGILSEDCLSLAERILDSAARLENGTLDAHAHVRECQDAASVYPSGKEAWAALQGHLCLEGEQSPDPLRTSYPSLQRADTYLLSLCPIPMDAPTFLRAARAWRSLMSFLLVQDDLADIREDIERGQENAFLEAGLTAEAAAGVMSTVDEGLAHLRELNPVLAQRLDERRSRIDIAAILGPYLG